FRTSGLSDVASKARVHHHMSSQANCSAASIGSTPGSIPDARRTMVMHVFWSAGPSPTDQPCCAAKDGRSVPIPAVSGCSNIRKQTQLVDHLIGAREEG